MYSKIVNPKTGREVSIGGKLGRGILRNYLIILSGGKIPIEEAWKKRVVAPESIVNNDKLATVTPMWGGKYSTPIVESSSNYLQDKHLHYTNLLNDLGGEILEDISPNDWSYDELCDFLIAEQIPKTDAEEIIKYAWTKWYNNQSTVSPHIATELGFANINTNS